MSISERIGPRQRADLGGRPGALGGDARRATPSTRQDRADRQRELVSGRRHGSPGQLADQQVRGRAARASATTAAANTSTSRSASPRSGPSSSSRRRARQRPAPFRSPANMAAYFSVLEPGDRILGMKLDQGGHLTHGMKLNFSGRLYEVTAYASARTPSGSTTTPWPASPTSVRPKLIVAGASAYPRIIDFKRMAEIAHGVGALLFVDMAHIAGLVAAGVHPSPFPHADIVTRRRTRRSAAHAAGSSSAAWSCLPRSTPSDSRRSRRLSRRRSTRRSSRVSRADRSCT